MSEMPIELPARRMLADEVYDAIRRSIVANQLPAGSKINLDQLAREIQVSNTPIRQALSRLEAEGLVVKEPYRGYTVTELLGFSRLEYVYEARLTLEAPIAALAAARRSEAQLDHLRSCLKQAEQDIAGAAHLDAEFHTIVAESSGNPMLSEQIERLLTWTPPAGITYDLHGGAELAWEEHAAVFEALERGDSEAASAAMRRHLENAIERFRNLRETPEG